MGSPQPGFQAISPERDHDNGMFLYRLCMFARRSAIQMHVLHVQVYVRSTPVDPNAFPICSDMLSLHARQSKCVSYMCACALARHLSIKIRLQYMRRCALGRRLSIQIRVGGPGKAGQARQARQAKQARLPGRLSKPSKPGKRPGRPGRQARQASHAVHLPQFETWHLVMVAGRSLVAAGHGALPSLGLCPPFLYNNFREAWPQGH